MKLNVPRTFYVNCRDPDATGLHRRVNRLLPRSQPSLNLHEYTFTEQEVRDGDYLSYFLLMTCCSTKTTHENSRHSLHTLVSRVSMSEMLT